MRFQNNAFYYTNDNTKLTLITPKNPYKNNCENYF